jgi:hypothetical protein
MSAKMPRTYGEMVDAGEPISDVFDAVMSLHGALKEAPVKDRVWRYEWTHDGRAFSLTMNGHLQKTVDGLDPLHVVIDVDGLPRVLTDPFNGGVMGPDGTEDMVVRAIRDEIARLEAGR